MIQIAIVEDDHTFLNDLLALIEGERDMNCLFCRTSMAEFYQALETGDEPDILLLEQDIGPLNTLEHLEKVYQLRPEISVIIMSAHENPVTIRKSLLMGVSGYYYKGKDSSTLLMAIREIIGGNAYLSPKAAKIVLEMLRSNREGLTPERQLEKMATSLPWNASQRELSVIRGLLDGKSYKEIASSNFMTIDGVRYYVRRIYPKLGVYSRDQLVKLLGRT